MLLVPNRAVTQQGSNTVVQVINNGVIQTVTITTGVSDLSNTEVTSGLTEGEQVVVPKAATTTTSAPGGPGGGGFLRF